MIRSMTAFARRESRGEWGALTWELRSLNNRYLEVSVRLPEDLRGLETAVRERLARRLSRGKVDCNLRFRRDPAATGGLGLNEGLARQVLALTEQAQRLGPALRPAGVMQVLGWPGVVEQAEVDLEPLNNAALALLEQAIDELVATREREGEDLRGLIDQRLATMSAQVAQVRGYLPQIRAALRQRLEARLAELDVTADPGRLEQELVLQLQKIDVDEELDRLQTHIAEIAAVLQRNEPVGRRLDFLMQELNRESNTLGSKSAAADTTAAAVELKVLIEQMREQVQNIE